MADARILMLLLRRPALAARFAEDSAVVRQTAAVSQLVARKLQNERKYLARLEGAEPDQYCFLAECCRAQLTSI